MFTREQYRILFAFHFDTTWRMLEAAGRLNVEDYRAEPGYGRGSVHDLLFHLLRTDAGWRGGLETGQQPPPLPAEEYADLPALRHGFEQERTAWEALLEDLTDGEITGDVSLTTQGGYTAVLARWRVLQHLVLHGMQHHAEIAQLLTSSGQSPGDIDFIFYEGARGSG